MINELADDYSEYLRVDLAKEELVTGVDLESEFGAKGGDNNDRGSLGGSHLRGRWGGVDPHK
uniref:Uncharacterized protein n=1 Tax=Timema cristinae TaxID=61476 RepID=A0A7R9DBP7_TIMCR|nr:unnamed protein product [Timema cristinae]